MNEDSFYRQLRREAPSRARSEIETATNEERLFRRRVTARTSESAPDTIGEAVGHEMCDATRLKTLEGRLSELRQRINRLEEEIQDAQTERDFAMRKAEMAEKNVKELKEEMETLHPDREGPGTVQTRRLLLRDRQITDLSVVRNNLRAEVIRRNGRIVGAHGEVNREIYILTRWEEAGQREQEGRLRIYRDVWGPEGDDNIPREKWPPEYQPGSPLGDMRDDKLPSNEEVLADKGRENSEAAQF